MSAPTHTVVWRGLAEPSLEYFTLRQRADGWQLAGTVVGVQDDQPLLVTYVVTCDAHWQTRVAELTVAVANNVTRTLVLQPTGGAWWLDGEPIDVLTNCIDVDLGITPATNTLPIRRLNLAIGEGADVVATWVRFPDLTVQPLSQRYTRIAEHRYHYESDTGFECDLDVDEDGIVTSYPRGWERIG